MTVENWVNNIANSLQGLWDQVLSFLPNLLGALIVFIVGLIVAAILERVVERILFYLRIDSLFKKLGVEGHFDRANIKLNIGHFLGRVVYWFIVIAFLLAASDILGFFALSGFLADVLRYIPQVIIAVLILMASLVAANFLKKLVVVSVTGARLSHANGLGTLTWWVVVVFGFLTALSQLGVAVTIINTLITGFIAMLAIAGGLAFGLGGKERAGKFIDRFGDEMSGRK